MNDIVQLAVGQAWIGDLLQQYKEAEKRLWDAIETIHDVDGHECRCDEREPVEYVHDGNMFKELLATCANCGGYIEMGECI